MLRTSILTIALAMSATTACAADPVEGRWATPPGDIVEISRCGDALCLTLLDGKHAGVRIGRLKAVDRGYSGTLTNPDDGRTYEGSGLLKGSTLALRGCVLKLFCQSRVWRRAP